jgi:hypothetical protein
LRSETARDEGVEHGDVTGVQALVLDLLSLGRHAALERWGRLLGSAVDLALPSGDLQHYEVESRSALGHECAEDGLPPEVRIRERLASLLGKEFCVALDSLEREPVRVAASVGLIALAMTRSAWRRRLRRELWSWTIGRWVESFPMSEDYPILSVEDLALGRKKAWILKTAFSTKPVKRKDEAQLCQRLQSLLDRRESVRSRQVQGAVVEMEARRDCNQMREEDESWCFVLSGDGDSVKLSKNGHKGSDYLAVLLRYPSQQLSARQILDLARVDPLEVSGKLLEEPEAGLDTSREDGGLPGGSGGDSEAEPNEEPLENHEGVLRQTDRRKRLIGVKKPGQGKPDKLTPRIRNLYLAELKALRVAHRKAREAKDTAETRRHSRTIQHLLAELYPYKRGARLDHGSEDEKSRKNVSRCLRRVLKAIEAKDRVIGSLLRSRFQESSDSFTYEPKTPSECWEVKLLPE